MKIGIITKPNKKGQIVIPKKIRDKLYITENTPLNLVVRDNGIYIYPVGEVVGKSESQTSNEAFLELLKRTRGAWGKPSKEDIKREKQRDKLEKLSSKKNKNAW